MTRPQWVLFIAHWRFYAHALFPVFDTNGPPITGRIALQWPSGRARIWWILPRLRGALRAGGCSCWRQRGESVGQIVAPRRIGGGAAQQFIPHRASPLYIAALRERESSKKRRAGVVGADRRCFVKRRRRRWRHHPASMRNQRIAKADPHINAIGVDADPLLQKLRGGERIATAHHAIRCCKPLRCIAKTVGHPPARIVQFRTKISLTGRRAVRTGREAGATHQ